MVRIEHFVFAGCLATLTALTGCATETADAASSDQANLTESAAASVHFAADVSTDPSWSATPHAGGQLQIDYDFARLPECRNQGSSVSWVVEANWRFDGGAIQTAALPGSPGTGTTLADSSIDIPEGAKSIELWFENRAVGGLDHCTAFDSKFGANYRHDIE